ncbi:MAG: 50S ribosomal protein L20 [Candidatus Dojkabacteria bacterium]|nr:50S ribosomal protein L20 [Candidatus Dojkabacteria bacterium]
MRIKRGTNKRRRHKKILKLAKGYRMTYSRLYRRAKEAVLHAGQYSFAHRRRRRSQMRTEFIKIISSSLVPFGISYNKFINHLKTNNISINRKSLAEMCINSPEDFKTLVNQVVPSSTK